MSHNCAHKQNSIPAPVPVTRDECRPVPTSVISGHALPAGMPVAVISQGEKPSCPSGALREDEGDDELRGQGHITARDGWWETKHVRRVCKYEWNIFLPIS